MYQVLPPSPESPETLSSVQLNNFILTINAFIGLGSFKNTNQDSALQIWDSGPRRKAAFGFWLGDGLQHGPWFIGLSNPWMVDSTATWGHIRWQMLCFSFILVVMTAIQTAIFSCRHFLQRWDSGKEGAEAEEGRCQVGNKHSGVQWNSDREGGLHNIRGSSSHRDALHVVGSSQLWILRGAGFSDQN